MGAVEAVLGQVPVLAAELGGLAGSGSGADGATFTPSVAGDGTLSWTNDKGLENPAPVNIMGPRGPQGEQGPRGEKGDSGTLDDSVLEAYLPKSGGEMSGALLMGNNVPIYVGTAGGGMVLLGMMNADNVMGIGSANYPLVIHGETITLDHLSVADTAGARANLSVPGRPLLLWTGAWSSGDLTVAESGGTAGCTGLGNVRDYKFLAFVSDEGCLYFVVNTGTRLIGGGNYYSENEEYSYAVGFGASLSGNTITKLGHHYSNINHTSRRVGNMWGAIVEIYGLTKFDDIVTP